MNTFQKIIKYLAIAFAIFLSVSIIGGIMTGLAGLSVFFSKEETAPDSVMQEYSIDETISSLTVKLSGANLQIRTAEAFLVESNHNYISVKTDNGKLSITETKKVFSSVPQGVTVIIYVPEDFVFGDATIDAGAGKLEIDGLSADALNVSLGAGKANIKNLIANRRAEIDGGAGELIIDGGKLCNLNLDMGAGRLKLESRIEGKSFLDFGVGETELTLLGNREEYSIEIDKGIGKAELAGETMWDDSVYGNGENFIEIDGGIGAITIEFYSERVSGTKLFFYTYNYGILDKIQEIGDAYERKDCFNRWT